MKDDKYFVDDRVIIAEDLLKMTEEELDFEIARLEEEHKQKKTAVAV